MPLHHRLLEFIGVLTKTVILVPHPIAIGNFCEEIYFGYLKARREKKKLLLILPFPLPGPLRLLQHNNREVLDIQSDYRSDFQDSAFYNLACWVITLYYGVFRAISIACGRLFGFRFHDLYTVPMMGQETLWQPTGSIKKFSWDIVDQYQWSDQASVPVSLELSSHQKNRANLLRKEMGLPAEAWFACLHVRDGGFYGDHGVSAARNARIDNYLEAIREITDRGGWVIRMGDSSMPRLPTMERVIDYPFISAKSHLMDMYLIQNCRVYIGMLSGILDMAMLFQRPIILTNMPNWLVAFPHKLEDMGLFKHAYSISEKRFVSPLEWPTLPWGGHSDFAPLGNYELHENSPEELRLAVAEYLDRDSNWTLNPEQTLFNRIRLEQGKKLLDGEMIAGHLFGDMLIRYRFAARLLYCRGALSATFLQGSK